MSQETSVPTRPLRALVLAALLVIGLAAPARAGTSSSGATGGAFRHVLALAGTIGPRKTGTEADRRAADYVRAEMESAGLSVTVQDLSVARYDEGERSVHSRNVIGRLQGSSRDTVIVAAHHDSRNAAVPGANDDASGVAVLLEVARRAAARPHRLTYEFISFCAEEEGLLGSREFVAQADLAPVRAVIALELVGRGELLVAPVPRPPALWAQQLLLRAGRETGVEGVASRPLWSIAPRLLNLPYSSDHEPFLERNVPAFLLSGTYPAWTYHTTEDAIGVVREKALERAVRVVDGILIDLERAPLDPEDDPHYLPLTLFGRGILVPSTALTLVSCAALLGFCLLVLRRMRAVARPRVIAETIRVIIVASAATALGLSGMFLSETLMERLHHVRYPWMAHQGMHLAQGGAWTLFTGWLGLNFFRRIKPTVEPGPYLAAAFLVPVLCVVAALRTGWPEIAVFMAWPVAMFLASRFVESTGRKLALGLCAAAPFTTLLTPGDYRTLIELGGVSPPAPVLFGAVFLLAMPFVLYVAHVASFQDCLHSRFWWWLSGRRVGLAALVVSIALAGANAVLASYDYRHRQVVRVRQRVDVQGRRATAMVRSLDTLRGVRLRVPGLHAIDPEATTDRLDLPFPAGRVAFEASAATGDGSEERVVTTELKAPIPTDRISYVFTSRSGFRVPGRGDALRHRYTFVEIAPRHDPVGTFRLLVPDGGDLSVELKADFEDDLLGLDAAADGPRVFVYQATVEASRHLVGTR